MVLFVVCALLTFVIVTILIVPYFRGLDEKAVKSEYNISIYRDQLAELDRDVKRGMIVPEEEAAARTEIERRMLAEAKSEDMSPSGGAKKTPLLWFGLLGLMPVVAGIIYFLQGSPDQPASAFGERQDLAIAPDGADGMHSGMGDMVETLTARLRENPDDAEGWALLARSLVNLNRYNEAIEAYREANRIVGGRDRQLAAEYAETLVVGNAGIVGPESRMIFTAFVEENPNDPQATYYLGLAKAQNGDTVGAMADWQRLIDNSPPDAPWLPVVQQQMTAVRDGGELAATTPAPAQPVTPPSSDGFEGPTTADISAAQNMTGDQQGQMIEGMVAGLAARLEKNPDDLAGWQRLARSYTVLGRLDEAQNAYEQILRLSPDDAKAKAALDLE